jgi:hypothetical protein
MVTERHFGNAHPMLVGNPVHLVNKGTCLRKIRWLL